MRFRGVPFPENKYFHYEEEVFNSSSIRIQFLMQIGLTFLDSGTREFFDLLQKVVNRDRSDCSQMQGGCGVSKGKDLETDKYIHTYTYIMCAYNKYFVNVEKHS